MLRSNPSLFDKKLHQSTLKIHIQLRPKFLGNKYSLLWEALSHFIKRKTWLAMERVLTLLEKSETLGSKQSFTHWIILREGKKLAQIFVLVIQTDGQDFKTIFRQNVLFKFQNQNGIMHSFKERQVSGLSNIPR